MQELSPPSGELWAQAMAVNADGSVIVGSAGLRSLRWLNGTPEELPNPDSFPHGWWATHVNSAGTAVLGYGFSAPTGVRPITYRVGGQATDVLVALAAEGANLSGWSIREPVAISEDGQTVVGRGFSPTGERAWIARLGRGTALLFRESCDPQWSFGPEQIPGWDHVGLFVNNVVYESHPGYGCAYGCTLGDCSGQYWDPDTQAFVSLSQDNGVQWQHSWGSFCHDSTSQGTTAASTSIRVPTQTAQQMAAFIELQADAPFQTICLGTFSLNYIRCLAESLQPARQKGLVDGSFTCVGLVERAAEEAGLNGGQGFVPSSAESFHVPFIGDVPSLSPVVLSWFAERGFNFADNGVLWGVFDPVDFMLTDPWGRRLGHTAELGTLNEIPGALFSGDGAIEYVAIPQPLPGDYQVRIVGLGGPAAVALGGSMEGRSFEGDLADGATHDIVITVPPPCRVDFNGADGVTVQDLYDYVAAWNSQAGQWFGSAEFDGWPGVTVQDIYEFVAAWNAGCP